MTTQDKGPAESDSSTGPPRVSAAGRRASVFSATGKGHSRGGLDASFGLMKFVSWGTLTLTLLSSLFLSTFLANYARKVLLDKQHDFAQLLANTLSTAISKRFYFPTYWLFGSVDLNNSEQYKRLDEVIQAALKDTPIQDVRIYDLSGVVIYALDKALIGQKGLGGEAASQAIGQEKYSYEFLSQTGALGAFFSTEIASKSVIMRTTGPLRIKGLIPVSGDEPAEEPGMSQEEPAQAHTPTQTPAQDQDHGQTQAPAQSAGADAGVTPGPAQALPHALPQTSSQNPGPGGAGENGQSPGRLLEVEGVIGGLEFTLDITPDYLKLITFQRIIIFSAVGTSLVLFFVLRMLIHRADRISAQRLREKEEFEREMVQNEKLVSMGRMVAGIAHEIRNPLGIIRSSSELLVSRLKDKDPLTSKIMAAIHEESVRLSKTVGDFLDYARPKTLKLEPVDLGGLLDQALGFLDQKCQAQGIEVVRDYPRGLVVPADKDLLYRALYNILVNALEAMAGQNATVDAGDGVLGQIVVQAGVKDGAVVLSILDTGPGIPPDIRDKLLDPFFTTKESGTGLGLAITANILRSHGASLTLNDNPEGGARVDIAFARN
jgi:signal transduction histidine kinase